MTGNGVLLIHDGPRLQVELNAIIGVSLEGNRTVARITEALRAMALPVEPAAVQGPVEDPVVAVLDEVLARLDAVPAGSYEDNGGYSVGVARARRVVVRLKAQFASGGSVGTRTASGGVSSAGVAAGGREQASETELMGGGAALGFRVGDRVRDVRDGFEDLWGVVAAVTDGPRWPIVVRLDAGHTWSYGLSELALVEAAPAGRVWGAPSVAPCEWQSLSRDEMLCAQIAAEKHYHRQQRTRAEAAEAEVERCRAVIEQAAEDPDHYCTLTLSRYERDNLLALVHAVSGFAGTSPMQAANTGDWVMQILYKLNPGGPHAGDWGTPNHTGEQIVQQAVVLASRRRDGE